MKLAEGDVLGRGWVVTRASPDSVAAVLTPRRALRDLGLRVAQALVPAVLTTACAAYVASGGAWAPVVWPVLALLGVVCVAWALDVLRLGRRVLLPVVLDATRTGVRGVAAPAGKLLADYWEARLDAPRSAVKAVRVGPLAGSVAPPLERWRLSVDLADGRSLLGPELLLEPGAATERGRLEAFARALSGALQVPLMPA